MTQLIARYWAPGQFPDGVSDVIPECTVKSFKSFVRSAGQGRIELPNDALPMPASGGMITIDVDDGDGPVRAFAGLCRTMTRKTIAPDGDKDQRSTWNVPSHLAKFDKGLILPPNGPGSIPVADTVAFNWTHPEFDDSAWTGANSICTVAGAQVAGATPWGGGGGNSWSDKWTEPNSLAADIIGPNDGTVSNVSNPAAVDQFHYFRQVINVSVAGRHLMAVSNDNIAEYFCDGVLLGTYDKWTDLTFLDFDLSVGTHTIGVMLQNIPTPTGNPTGYAWALYRPGYPPPFIARSDASDTVHVEYQADPPGMAATQALSIVIQDLVDVGLTWASDIIEDYTNTLDSAGVTLPIEPNITAEVGSTVLDFIEKLMATYLDVWMDPNDWTLHAYEFGTWSPPSGLALDASVLTELDHATEDTVADKLLVRSDGLGWTIVGGGTDALGFVSLGSEIAAYDVVEIATEIINVYGLSRLEIATRYVHSAVANGTPWAVAPDPSDPSSPCLVPGSTGTAPDLDGDPTVERALSIEMIQAEGSEDVVVAIVWKDVIQEFAERVVRELKQ